MNTLVQFSDYQTATGYWQVGYYKSFKAGRDNFVLPARAMGMRLDEYYQWVIDNFDPIIRTHNDKGLIVFGWTNYNKAHKLTLLLNKEARKRNLYLTT